MQLENFLSISWKSHYRGSKKRLVAVKHIICSVKEVVKRRNMRVFQRWAIRSNLCDLMPYHRTGFMLISSRLVICLQHVGKANPWASAASRTVNWDKHERFIENGVLALQHMTSPLQSLSFSSNAYGASLMKKPSGNGDLSHWAHRA